MEQPESYMDNRGNKYWYLPSKGKDYYHRLDGPAVEWADGSKEWWINNKKQRADGPAVEWADRSKMWYIDGKLHRIDGPATEWPDGTKEWWVNGIEQPLEEVESWIEENKINLKTETGQIAFKLRWS